MCTIAHVLALAYHNRRALVASSAAIGTGLGGFVGGDGVWGGGGFEGGGSTCRLRYRLCRQLQGLPPRGAGLLAPRRCRRRGGQRAGTVCLQSQLSVSAQPGGATAPRLGRYWRRPGCGNRSLNGLERNLNGRLTSRPVERPCEPKARSVCGTCGRGGVSTGTASRGRLAGRSAPPIGQRIGQRVPHELTRIAKFPHAIMQGLRGRHG